MHKSYKYCRVRLYTDSLVCLNWLNSHVNNLDKLRNLSVFIKNRLNRICRLCDNFPVKFSFCEGLKNPADAVTRPLSYKLLVKSNYFNVENLLANDKMPSRVLDVIVPNPYTEQEKSSSEDAHCYATVRSTVDGKFDHIVLLNSYSSFRQFFLKYIVLF